MSHELPNQDYEPYAYDPDRGYSPLGAQALMGEQSYLQFAETVPEALQEFHTEYQKHHPEVTYDDFESNLAEHRKKAASDSPELLSLAITARAAELGSDSGKAEMEKILLETRDDLSHLTAPERTRGNKHFEAALDKDGHDVRPLFERWKNSSEVGQQVSLFDWLALDHGQGGPSDEQLRNVLQWNEYQYKKANRDPETLERLKTAEASYRHGLYEAVATGDIDKSILDNYVNQDEPSIVIGDALGLNLLSAHGYIQENKYASEVYGRMIVLRSEWTEEIYMHERTHLLGALRGDSDINEAATDIISAIIYDRSPSAAEHLYKLMPAYKPKVEILDSFLTLADMGAKDLSTYYGRRNFVGLLMDIKSKSDIELLAMRQKAYEGAEELNRNAGLESNEYDLDVTAAALLGGLKQRYLDKRGVQ